MKPPTVLLLGLFCMTIFLVSCANESSVEVTGTTWPTYEPVNGAWAWMNPQPTGNQLLDVTFVDENTGWTCGAGGTLLHTTDGGQHWISESLPTTADFNMIRFADASHGWMASRRSAYPDYVSDIWATTDGGQSWGNGPVTHVEDYVSDVCATGETDVWAVTSNGRIGHAMGNGPWTWQLPNHAYTFSGVSFINPQTGWVTGRTHELRQYYGFVLHTTDGGQSWTQLDSAASTYPSGLFFIDEQNGWRTTSIAEVQRTTDGGASWTTIYAGPYYDVALTRIHFTDYAHGWICGQTDYSNDTYWRTSDGGVTWIESEGVIRSAWFVDELRGWTVGNAGKIARTDNYGSSWTMQTQNVTDVYLWDVDFADAQTGWAVGNAATILRTTNGGAAWTVIQSRTGSRVEYRALTRTSATDLWVAGGESSTAAIARSSDGGLSWSEQSFSGMARLSDITFTSPTTGWAVGEGGIILHTTDTGDNWTLVSSGSSGTLRSISFADAQNGWICGGPSYQYGSGGDAIVLTTHDGGNHWTPTVFNGTCPLYAVYALDASHISITGQCGVILNSNDGGRNWAVQYSPLSTTLWKVFFLNPSVGWVAGEDGTLLSTWDGGNHWNAVRTTSANHFLGFYALDASHAWTVGADGTIMSFVPYDVSGPALQ